MNSYGRTALRVAIGLFLSVISGLLLTLAFPPYNIWPLVFVGFVPAVVAQYRIMPRRISGLAYGVAIGVFYWGYFGPMFAGVSPIMEWLPLIVAVIATLASNGDRTFSERTNYKWFVLSGAVVWVGIEAIRGFVPAIGTGGSVAFALYSQPWLIQPVGIFSLFGLGLLIMLANYALALGALALLDGRAHSADDRYVVGMKQAGRALGIVLALLVGWSALSAALLGQATTPDSTMRVAAIQPGTSPDQATHIQKLVEQTRDAAARGAQLVVWPEGTLSFDPTRKQSDLFKDLAKETGVYIALGYGFRVGDGLRNEAIVVTPQGEFLSPYGKDHPVVWMGETSLTGGTYPTHETPFGTVGTIICYDLNFTDTARKMAGNGATIIAVPSNDWSALGIKQYTNLVMRAVENRVALVKADGHYDSAVIDPTGRIVAAGVSTEELQNTIVADVHVGTADAPLVRLGDWVGWLCIAGIVAFTTFNIVVTRRARTASPIGKTMQPLPEPDARAHL